MQVTEGTPFLLSFVPLAFTDGTGKDAMTKGNDMFADLFQHYRHQALLFIVTDFSNARALVLRRL
jgi:hypothetical protein